MKLPKGMSEEEVLQVIDGIANRLAGKFKFGYHEIEDMKQQARMFAWEGLENYDNVRPLENFLWTHVRNRLYNFKRNNFGRPDKPCDSCPLYDMKYRNSRGYPCTEYDNEMDCDLYAGWLSRNTVKKNLMHTASLDMDITRTPDLEGWIDQKSIFNKIDEAIPVPYREDWIRFTHSLRLPKARRDAVISLVSDIAEGLSIES